MSDEAREEFADQEGDQVETIVGADPAQKSARKPFGSMPPEARQQIAAQVGQRVAEVKRAMEERAAESDAKIARLEAAIAGLVQHLQERQTRDQVSRPVASSETSALLELMREQRADNRELMSMLMQKGSQQVRDPLDDAMRLLGLAKMLGGEPADEQGGLMKFYEDAKRTGLLKDGLAFLLATRGELDSDSLAQVQEEHERFAATGSVEPPTPNQSGKGAGALPLGLTGKP